MIKATRRKWIAILAVISGLCMSEMPANVRAQDQADELKIAAVVNDEIITQLDVLMRLRIALLSARLPDTPEVEQRLIPQVLRQLIDDHLKKQEAKKASITVTQSEIDEQLDHIAQRNGMTRDQMQAQLSSAGVLMSALASQVEAEMSWVRLVQTKLRSSVRITDEEINEEVARIQASQGQLEYRVSEIFLAVDNPAQASAAQSSAQRLVDQLTAGADFASLATQFSQDQSAPDGGDLGWLRLDEMDPSLAQAIRTSQPNQVIGPILGIGGYYIAVTRATRPAAGGSTTAGTVSLKRVLWTLPPNAADSEVNKASDQAKSIAAGIRSCDDVQKAAADAPTAAYSDLGTVSIDELAPALQASAINQPIGLPTAPIRTGQGIGLYVVCSRQGGGLSRVAIADRLGRQRLETLARGYLSDLRRTAVVDMRM
ncbi:MAG TPA: peptidylprolyl isomerase [Terriglobia bacterium]|nr:peptidylprolyl isomerase [Terriglobia bacterium]